MYIEFKIGYTRYTLNRLINKIITLLNILINIIFVAEKKLREVLEVSVMKFFLVGVTDTH